MSSRAIDNTLAAAHSSLGAIWVLHSSNAQVSGTAMCTLSLHSVRVDSSNFEMQAGSKIAEALKEFPGYGNPV
jgi:hypothetical protein